MDSTGSEIDQQNLPADVRWAEAMPTRGRSVNKSATIPIQEGVLKGLYDLHLMKQAEAKGLGGTLCGAKPTIARNTVVARHGRSERIQY